MIWKIDLLGSQAVDGKGGEDHVFDAETGVDGVEPLLEQGCKVVRVAARPRDVNAPSA